MKNRRGGPSPGAKDAAKAASGVPESALSLRIVGGHLRGRKLAYSGDLRTRPMKDRVREAVFNLVGPAVIGRHVYDLFAGTGALGLEAISRGAADATFVEQHFPTAELIRQNAAALGVEQQIAIVPGSVFAWSRQAKLVSPLLAFCSPPYEFYVSRLPEMLDVIAGIMSQGVDTVFVCESDGRFDTFLLPRSLDWDVRQYPPAQVAMFRTATPPVADQPL